MELYNIIEDIKYGTCEALPITYSAGNTTLYYNSGLGYYIISDISFERKLCNEGALKIMANPVLGTNV